ncbi:ATP-binding protein [Spirulina sp. CS-785/01]|uniref:AAA family ATPase n=1 Tax=Spirulina sp. CS-785/01 TaxID=3021716 RepID=UPI00232AAD6C|nr:ATP-binding protein [Spirulina sp. CS-785/01]MDB9311749.1 ATP-binding protein [Spirulina sp. CS-785/01]
MLIEFSVANYRSFKKQVTLSLVAANLKAKDSQIDENNTFVVDEELTLVKSAAIYGANASGKSNIVTALNFMKGLMVNSSREGQSTDAIKVEPFRLSTATENEPSFFELVFRHEGIIYRYGFEAKRDRIISEWLYYVPNVRETRLFERNLDHFKVAKKYQASGLQKFTRPNALFLSVSAQFNVPIAETILNWITEQLKITSGLNDQGFGGYTVHCLNSKQDHNAIIQLIKKLDIGIHDIEVDIVDIEIDSLPKAMPDSIKEMLTQEDGWKQASIKTKHQKFNNNNKPIELKLEEFDLEEQESEGTQKIFAMAGPLINTLKEGKTLIIDEFDARLHPLISQKIIQLFNSPITNPKNAQIIFTTHDTNLLSNRLFRRDQIWFMEKDRYGATDLYSLAEYNIRNDATFERDYIKGKYGAIPYFGDFETLLNTDR